MAPPSSSLPDLDGMIDLVTRFEAACDEDDTLQTAEMDELLRLVPGRRGILSGMWQGRRVVFRLFLQPDSPAPARAWAEMIRVWPQMQTPPCCIAEPLHYSADHQLLVIAHAQGTPLMQHIWQSEPHDRAHHLPAAARWLRAYSQGSEVSVRPRAGSGSSAPKRPPPRNLTANWPSSRPGCCASCTASWPPVISPGAAPSPTAIIIPITCCWTAPA